MRNYQTLSYLLTLASLLAISGCSTTSLRCAVDGDSSFVEIYDVPQGFSQNTRAYKELCAFAYEGEK